MKKQILSLLIILLTSNIIISQNVKHTNENEETSFLGIDFTEKINDYLPEIDLSLFPVDEAGMVDLLVYLDGVIKDEDNFLKEFNFDKELARFNKNGDLFAIFLSKETTNVDEEFKQLEKLISKKYGNRTQYGNHTVEWQKEFYTISIAERNSELFVVCENNKYKDVQQKQQELPQTLESKRQKWISIDNEGFKENKHGAEMVRFERIENDDLAIYIQIPINLSSREFEDFENDYTKSACYVTAHLLFTSEKIKELYIGELSYKSIIFKLEYKTKDYKIIKKTKYINAASLRTLNVPFTESELYQILF